MCSQCGFNTRLSDARDEAVFLWSQISKLPPPHPKDLSNLQEWMRRPSMGGVFLVGRDRNVWAERKDLIAILAKPSDNKVFRLLADKLTPLYHYAFGKYHKVCGYPRCTIKANCYIETRRRDERVCAEYRLLLRFCHLPHRIISWYHPFVHASCHGNRGVVSSSYNVYTPWPCWDFHGHLFGVSVVHDGWKVN